MKRILSFYLVVILLLISMYGFKYKRPRGTFFIFEEDCIIYQTVEAARIVNPNDVPSSNASSIEINEGYYYAIHGKFDSEQKKGKRFTLSEGIKCEVNDDKIKDYVEKKCNLDDELVVFGKLSKNGKNKEVEVDTIMKFSDVKNDWGTVEAYSIDKDNNTIKDKILDTLRIDLKEGNKVASIKYRIPSTWKSCETNLEKYGSELSGYQYCLNKIHGNKISDEQFFVCYFNSSLLNDNKRNTNRKEIEKNIVYNIINTKSDSKDAKKAYKVYSEGKNYYGAKYDCIHAIYANKSTGKNYNCEFYFQEVGKEGLVMCIYLHEKEPKPQIDIYYVMSSLSIKDP